MTNTTSSTGGSYVAVTPTRICDTRSNQPANPCTGETLGTGTTLQVQVPTSVVPAGATGVVVNVTAVDPSAAGFLSVFPGGATVPTGSSLVSNLNFAAGDTVANLVTVGLSSTGTIEIYNHAGDTNVVVDVAGYYTSTPATSGSGLYNPISPKRVLGTLASGASIGANSATAVTVAGGSTGVPATATAVVVNLTAADATAPSFLTAFPAGATMPLASNLNFGAQVPNQAIANRATVKVGTGGQIMVYNHAGSVNVDVDVDGYYTGSGGTGSTFVAITPQRLTDTRSDTNGTPIAPSTSETFSLTNSSIPADAAAVAANFTVVPGADPGYLTVYPTSDTTVPVASDVNWTANESPAVPNFTVADTAGTGSVAAFNSHGATINLLIDAFGYFGPSNAPTAYSVTPSAAQSLTVSTAGAPQQGAVQYTATGLGTSPVNVELFAGANVTSTSPLTFASSAINSSGDASQGTPVSYLETVNGLAISGTSTTEVNDVTPVNGQVTFTINSTTVGSDVPVVYIYNSANSTQVLPVNSSGNPTVSAGAGGQASWSAVAAATGYYQDVIVTSVDASAGTFEATYGGGSTPVTFTYTASGDTYTYNDPVVGLTEAQFASFLSGPVSSPNNDSIGAVVGDEFANISYNSSGPSTFVYGGSSGNGDVPAAPTGLSATENSSSHIVLSWTAPPNFDVASYNVWRATVSSTGTVGAYAELTTNGTVTGTSYTDTSAAVGTDYSYVVTATAGSNGGGQTGPASAATTFEMAAPSYPPLPTAAIESAAAGESGAGNMTNDAITFNDSALGVAGGTALYASSVSDFATTSSGTVTLRAETLGTVTATGTGPSPAVAGDSVVIFNAGTTASPQYYYVDVTTETPPSPQSGTAYVGLVLQNSGGVISITYNGTSDGNTTSTDYLYIPVATGTEGSQTGWTIESAQTITVEVTTSGSGAIANGNYSLSAVLPG